MSTKKVSQKESKGRKKDKNEFGRRFSREQKEHALELIASGMGRSEVAEVVGTTVGSVRNWIHAAQKEETVAESRKAGGGVTNTSAPDPVSTIERKEPESPELKAKSKEKSIYAPRDPGQRLSIPEESAILELKRRHPSYGPAQIRTQLKRFKGWRVAVKAIARVLRQNGYELVHRGSRPKGYEDHRFEAPRRNALWQMDFGEFWVGREKLHLLAAEDDFSRYVVGHRLVSEKSTEVATGVLLEAMARHGKPEAVRTDRGGEFLAKDA